jgi:hypothetical protein
LTALAARHAAMIRASLACCISAGLIAFGPASNQM